MTLLLMTTLIGLGAFVAGLLGALTGLGGGIVIVPLLTIGFGVDIRYAAGASLISVIATSSGAAAAYIKEGYTNLRVGMLLEIATTLGALLGAWAAAIVAPQVVAVIFAAILLFTATQSFRPRAEHLAESGDALAGYFRLGSTYPVGGVPQRYEARNVPLGFGLMGVAGILSGLLGIGSGVVKVLALDRAMHLPFKVSTTTSNFMIGVTAAASAGVYFRRGWIDPQLALPVVLGVVIGAVVGARLLTRAPVAILRRLFSVVLIVLAIEMLHSVMTGRL